MRSVVLNGKKFIKASEAAKAAGYTADDVGQLCRSGKIDAQLVGRSWYVDQEALMAYRSNTKRTAKAKSREQVKRAVESVSKKRKVPVVTDVAQSAHFLDHRTSQIRYETDNEELIPNVRKLSVDSDTPVRTGRVVNAEPEEDYTIDRAGEKIVMSGTLEVVDFGDEEYYDEETVVLTADILHKEEIAALDQSESHADMMEVYTDDGPVNEGHFFEEVKELHAVASDTEEETSFMDKLATYDVDTALHTDVVDVAVPQTQDTRTVDKTQDAQETKNTPQSLLRVVDAGAQPAGFGFVIVTGVFVCVLCVSLLLPQTIWTYYAASSQYENAYVFESRLAIDHEMLVAYMIDIVH